MVSTTRCIYTCPVSSGMRPRPPPEVFWAIGFILQNAWPVTRCKQPLYIFSCYFSLKWSCLVDCLSHKRVKQKYRNSTLKKKQQKKTALGSESADTQNFLDRIWKNGIVASLFMTLPNKPITDRFILGRNPRVVNVHVNLFQENFCTYLSHIPSM